jgi:hypothetical protein
LISINNIIAAPASSPLVHHAAGLIEAPSGRFRNLQVSMWDDTTGAWILPASQKKGNLVLSKALHSFNPILSYNNDLFSGKKFTFCMLSTDMT